MTSSQRSASHTKSTKSPLLLKKPYPAPEIIDVTVEWDGFVGLSFLAKNSQVFIKSVDPKSPFHRTKIKPGMLCLAVHGIPVTNNKDTVVLVKSQSDTIHLTVCNDNSSRKPYFKTVVATTSYANPGINFAPTRANCLVSVSKVFRKGAFVDTNLNAGDIVLAVNGIPVSTCEQADNALKATVGQPTSIYAVDMKLFRAELARRLRADKSAPKDCQNVTLSFVEQYAVVNPETQHLYDPEAHKRLVAETGVLRSDFHNPQLFYKGQYRRVECFITEFNQRLDIEFNELEDDVCCAAWGYSSSQVVTATATAMSLPVATCLQLEQSA